MGNEPENADLLQELMDNIGDNIFFKDRDSKFIMINQANARFFGLDDPKDAVGLDDFTFFPEEHARRQIDEEQRIMRTGESIVGEEQFSEHDGITGWGSVTKVPLRDKEGRIIGTMGIGRDITELKTKERTLNEAHEQMAEDLRMAAKLQQTFLPQRYPSFEGSDGRPLIRFHHHYEAQVELGGDFCSVYRLDDNRAGLLICDVMGHGVRAALVTGIIYVIADELAHQAGSPGEFLTALNKRLAPVLQTGGELMFATAAYFTVDVSSGALEGALAGHSAPLLIQPQLGRVSPLEAASKAKGPALAIVEDFTYPTVNARLRPGDELLMYTDGIFEAMNSSSREFGEEHLRETIEDYKQLPLQLLVQRVVEVVREHAGSTKLGDDVCLLGFKLEGTRETSPSDAKSVTRPSC